MTEPDYKELDAEILKLVLRQSGCSTAVEIRNGIHEGVFAALRGRFQPWQHLEGHLRFPRRSGKIHYIKQTGWQVTTYGLPT